MHATTVIGRAAGRRWRRGAVLGAIVAVVLSGCGSQGPARHRVHGTVSHAGRPVPLGRIVFEPDVLKENRGPQGFAIIENGRFDTAAGPGRGTSGGPMVVTIDGYDAAAAAPAAAPKPLFTGHREHRDLPKTESEMTFDVPAVPSR